MSDVVIANIRKRVAQCRRLADSTLDRQVRVTFLQMAAEGEADIRKLEAARKEAARPTRS